MKLKNAIAYGSTLGLWLLVAILWWKGFSETTESTKLVEADVQRKVEQAYDIQVQSALRIKELEDKVELLEQEMLELTGVSDGEGPVVRSSAETMRKINYAYEHVKTVEANCACAGGVAPVPPAAATAREPASGCSCSGNCNCSGGCCAE